ncbi:MAG: hypothetical protein EBR82_70650 [Caulobacteraceae bacterium]|nr:hypothetical protein [Caulobacteraceae bacterium]
MYGARTYNIVAVQPYIDVVGIVAGDIVIIDRNGIGIKHSTAFGGTQTVNVYTYEWYGIRLGSLSSGNYLITISNTLTGGNREILYEFGPTPVAGTTYSVYYGSTIAKYRVATGNTTTNVRDGLKSAIDAAIWGTTVTTTSVSTNRLRVNITGATVNLVTQLGTEKYKKGRYTTISGTIYIIIEQEAATAYPTLPSVAASYAFNSLTAITGTVEAYLSEPLTTYTYTDSLTTTTQITGIPVVGSVNPGECVVDETAQRIWFDADLNFGEIIKVFQK